MECPICGQSIERIEEDYLINGVHLNCHLLQETT